jgi:tRNA threonylcarbamoyladenosine biosynthesis protein TsaE
MTGRLLKGGDVVLLRGDLGAGKTHFAKGVAQGLEIRDPVCSPTFNLVLEYPVPPKSDTGSQHPDNESTVCGDVGETYHVNHPQLLRHFDLYRLDDTRQLESIDYFGLIEDERAVSLVEWGTKFVDGLPLDYLLVDITIPRNATPTAVGSPSGRTENLIDDLLDDSTNLRLARFTAHGGRSEQLLTHIATAFRNRAVLPKDDGSDDLTHIATAFLNRAVLPKDDGSDDLSRGDNANRGDDLNHSDATSRDDNANCGDDMNRNDNRSRNNAEGHDVSCAHFPTDTSRQP